MAGAKLPKLTPVPMTAPVGRSQQALGLLFRRATPLTHSNSQPCSLPILSGNHRSAAELSRAVVGLETKRPGSWLSVWQANLLFFDI